MSKEDNSKDSSNSQSGSSSGSSTQMPFFQDHVTNELNSDLTDLTLFGSPAPTLTRTGTVRRASSASVRKEKDLSIVNSNEETENNVFNKNEKASSPDHLISSRYRKSLETTFRHSLESISEYKPKRCFSPSSMMTSTSTSSREHSTSLDSSCSDHTDVALRCSIDTKEEGKTIQSQSSSYLTWIESVNSEYFGSAVSSTTEIADAENKVGEWNNFWLNYNSARDRYISTPYLSAEDKLVDDFSEVKSTCSTHRDLTEKQCNEYITLTTEEIHETIRCTQRITEILQNALRRNDHDFENSNLENSYYSESLSRQNSSIREDPNREVTREDIKNMARERSFSYVVNPSELLKQKELLKPAVQSSSTSCINALLNTGVADILKRVINKRRDVMSPDDVPSITRSSFSEWSGK